MAGWTGIAVASLMQLVWRHPLAAVAGARARGAGRGVHRHLPRHRLALGPADLGHLVGMGRADDLDARPALPLFRLSSRWPARSGRRAGRGGSTAIFGLVGAVNLPIIHYSVIWWSTLHQGQSIGLVRGSSSIDASMLWPLLVVGARLHPAVRRDRADADAGRAGAATRSRRGCAGWRRHEPLAVHHRRLCASRSSARSALARLSWRGDAPRRSAAADALSGCAAVKRQEPAPDPARRSRSSRSSARCCSRMSALQRPGGLFYAPGDVAARRPAARSGGPDRRHGRGGLAPRASRTA